MVIAAPICCNGTALSISLHHSSLSSQINFAWGWKKNQVAAPVARVTNGQAFQVTAARGSSTKEFTMVDPIEAKRLAAKQMQEIRAEEKFQRRREIEAINGAVATIGLTIGLVIEGQTGRSIITQLDGYWSGIVNLLMLSKFF